MWQAKNSRTQAVIQWHQYYKGDGKSYVYYVECLSHHHVTSSYSRKKSIRLYTHPDEWCKGCADALAEAVMKGLEK